MSSAGCNATFQRLGSTLTCAQGKAVLELGRGFSPSYDDQNAATGFATGANERGSKAWAGVRSGAPSGPVPSSMLSSPSGLVQAVHCLVDQLSPFSALQKPTARALKKKNIIIRDKLIISACDSSTRSCSEHHCCAGSLAFKGVATHAVTRLSNQNSVQVYCHYTLTSDSRDVRDYRC